MVYNGLWEGHVKAYTIGQVARMAGVSVRTLHHYDQIGLLKPSARSAAGYRLYEEQDLLRLQQILFFKELDMPLREIGDVLDDPGYDQVEALEQHRQLLQGRMERLARLLKTIDRTIERITEDSMAITDAELYAGFTPEQAERYRREAREKYDPALVEESERRLRQMSKAQWDSIKAEGDEVTRSMAALMGRPPGDAEVQQVVARHYAWIEHFWTPTAEAYRGLGQGYVDNPEFRAFYDRYAPGLADFLAAAMRTYADEVLADQ
jgi:DNA-binding transcriptional MerR regulator